MDLEKYFSGLEKKYNGSEIILDFKNNYFEYLKDLQFKRQRTLLRSLKVRVKADYEVNLIKEKFKDVFDLMGKYETFEKPKRRKAKAVLEELVNKLKIVEAGLDGSK